MNGSRNDLLGELAADAALERSDFLVQATDQLRRFLDANRERINELGGLTLIDEDPDYLSVAPDLTFRSRTREFDDATGKWMSETEVIEHPSELVELYNPADIYSAFAEAAREAAGLGAEPTATDELMDTAMVAPEESFPVGSDPYAAAADEWAATQPSAVEADDEESAARRLYDLALEYQERSQRSEANLLEQFEAASSNLAERVGDVLVVDDEDERLTLTARDGFRAQVVPEESNGEWKALNTPEELVEFYDPTDVFGDLADSLAEGWPAIAADEEEGAVEAQAVDRAGGDDDDDTDGPSRNGSAGKPRS